MVTFSLGIPSRGGACLGARGGCSGDACSGDRRGCGGACGGGQLAAETSDGHRGHHGPQESLLKTSTTMNQSLFHHHVNQAVLLGIKMAGDWNW